MLPLLLDAVLVPPHARVNYRCYPRWKGQSSVTEGNGNLEVVWRDAVWQLPSQWTFN